MSKENGINIKLFDDCNKILLDILDNAEIDKKEKEYRKKRLMTVYNDMVKGNYRDSRYYDMVHEIKSLEFLSKYPNLQISNDHKGKSGCDFKIYSNYNVECVNSSSGNKIKNGLDKFDGFGVFDYNVKENIILTRLSQSIKEKKIFYDNHIANGTIKVNEPYVVFLSSGDLREGSFFNSFGFTLNKILLGVGHEKIVFDAQNNKVIDSFYEHKDVIYNHNNSEICSNIFGTLEYECLSGVLFTTASLDEHYTKDNTFLFINPFAKNKICANKFSDIIYWNKYKNPDGKLVYYPRYKGKNLNDKLKHKFF